MQEIRWPIQRSVPLPLGASHRSGTRRDQPNSQRRCEVDLLEFNARILRRVGREGRIWQVGVRTRPQMVVSYSGEGPSRPSVRPDTLSFAR
jgi:hypothetical protein